MSKISRKRFEERLVHLILSGGEPGLPRRLEDRRVLLTAICLELDRRRVYSQRELDEHFTLWPYRVGGRFGLDPATIRRALIDDGMMLRDRAGHEYRVSTDILQGECEPTVLDIDPIECLVVERERRMVRKLQARERHSGGETAL